MSDPALTPRQVDGFVAARALGLLPQVPEAAPSPLPPRTARRAFTGWLVSIVAGSLAWIAVVSACAGPLDRVLPVAGPLLLVAGALAVFVQLFVRGRARVGDAFLDELAAGYTTLPLTGGALWGVNRRGRPNYQEPWDFRGVWVLDGGGGVLSSPDRDVDPPGLYPSPERPGQLRVWTGTVWARKFRAPARPFTTQPPHVQH